jgi:hypothetical protein
MDEELENAIEKSSTSSLVMALVESVTQRMAIEGFNADPEHTNSFDAGMASPIVFRLQLRLQE